MPKFNELIVNGRSTGDLPFFCGVTENSSPTRARNKNKYSDLEMVNGVVVQTIDAWEPIDKSYIFYLYDVSKSDIRVFKSFIGYSGWFTPFDDPDIHYNFVDAVFESEPLDEFNGYTITVTFTCEPFEYESEKVTNLSNSIKNHTTAPMYPKLVIKAKTTSSTFLQIGDQRMTFPNGIDTSVTVECKQGLQNVLDKTGNKMNSKVRGPFFEITPGEHAVTKGTGITKVEITERWGWL